MIGTTARQHVTALLVAIVTTVTTLSVTYHLLRRSHCLSITPAAHAALQDSLPSGSGLTCSVRF